MPAFDSAVHEIDPLTGFQLDKDTGNISGVVAKPPIPATEPTEWPKWVKLHESQIVRRKNDGAPDHVSAPDFEEFHVDRVTGEVSALVEDEDEAKRAMSVRREEGGVLLHDEEPLHDLRPLHDDEPLRTDGVFPVHTDNDGALMTDAKIVQPAKGK